MNRNELLNKVRNCTPNLGWEYTYPELFGKYGMTNTNRMSENWIWFEKNNIPFYLRNKGCAPLSDASDNELLEMWAISDNYWLNKYKKWCERAEEKSSKLDEFIGICERKYFGYDKDGYTNKTIERVFDSIFKILDS